ncbi:MAG TPA: efflux RND transporter periplasmic adaptor subunit [Candidatus Hydrogenedentes bacterium]|nr:efflux RND transporter periplasmic adaptor subunit [Candidatus Hydrogenedentota bacterium]
MQIRRRSKRIAALGTLFAGVALMVYVQSTRAAESPKGGDAGGPPPAEVAVIIVQTEQIPLTTELPGRTAGYLVSDIRPQVNGIIQKRLFTEGSDVKAGDTLYQIDPAPFQAAYASAVANLDAAKKTLEKARAALGASIANVARQQATVALAKTDSERAEDLFKDKAVSATERDHAVTALEVANATLQVAEAEVESGRAGIASAEAAIKQAEAAVEMARINLDYTKIKAPISGRIGRSSITEGAAVTAYQPLALATIQQLDPIYVDVTQSTADVARLRARIEKGHLQEAGTGQNKVKLLMEDGTEYPLEGTLGFRDVTVDPTTGSVILRIVAPNPDGILLPGMFIRAVIEEGIVDQAILIPQQAVSRDRKGLPLAMVVGAENKVEPRPLVVERAIGDKWLVTSGLAVGDHVIVEGLQKARPGSPVKEVPFEAGKKDAMPAGNAPQPAPKSN